MNLSDFCRCYTNAADHELVKEMLHWFREDTESKTVTANRDTRNDLQKWVPVGTHLYNKIEQVKRTTLDIYLDEFPYVYKGAKKLVSEETKIQRTAIHGGGFHNFHSEISHYKNIRRVLTWALYLNDVPEGEGETQFLLEDIKIQPKRGMMAIFPAAFPWQHRGNPVYKHSKYISTGWWLFPEEGKMD